MRLLWILFWAMPIMANDTIHTRERELEQVEVIGEKSDFQVESLRLVSDRKSVV